MRVFPIFAIAFSLGTLGLVQTVISGPPLDYRGALRALQGNQEQDDASSKVLSAVQMAEISRRILKLSAGCQMFPSAQIGGKPWPAPQGSLREFAFSIGKLHRGGVLEATDSNVTVAFEHASDLYGAVDSLRKLSDSFYIHTLCFQDQYLFPLEDADRKIHVQIRFQNRTAQLNLELSSFLDARRRMKGEIRLHVRQKGFHNAYLNSQRKYREFAIASVKNERAVKDHLLNKFRAQMLAAKALEASVTPPPRASTGTERVINRVQNLNPNGTLCPQWNEVSVNHDLKGEDKVRTFMWGLLQPPCHPDRIRSGHLLYKVIFDSYQGFQFSQNPQVRAQQQLLKSVYLATADYLRARPTAPQNQMCRPEEKVRIYRGSALMPIYRKPGAAQGAQVFPALTDQMVWMLKGGGQLYQNGFSAVTNRDPGELAFENQNRFSGLTWNFIEGVSNGWQFMLGLQRSSVGSEGDQDKNGIPEGGDIVPGSRERPTLQASWREPGKTWYRLDGMLQRILTLHSSTSVYSPFLSASFNDRVARNYGPLMMVMDVCPERLLPNFEVDQKYTNEEELYLPFFILPEEIVRIEGRDCLLAKSGQLTGPNDVTDMDKVCEAYNSANSTEAELVNRQTDLWRSYFRNFDIHPPRKLDIFVRFESHLKASQQTFYSLLGSGLKASPLNPSGEMTLARWRDIARNQVRGFTSCKTQKENLGDLQGAIEDSRRALESYLARMKTYPDPTTDPGIPAGSLIKPDGTSAADPRLSAIANLKREIDSNQREMDRQKKISGSKCL